MENSTLTPEQTFEILKNQELRIDHNFSTVLNITILSEYLFQKLNTAFPDLNLEAEFEKFQNEKLQEFNEIVEEAKAQSENIQEQTEEIINQIKL